MKKLLLSGFVIGLFIIYGLSKQEDANGALIVPTQQGQNANNTLTVPQAPAGNGNPPQQQQPTAVPTQVPTQAPANNPPASSQGQYKDGSYTGSVADAFYGNIQVQVTISGGRITDVQFLQYPSDRNTSVMINTQAMPYLKQEAIAAQSANVDIVSGATDSSQAFQQSLASALAQAH